jgi:hypothetical protein
MKLSTLIILIFINLNINAQQTDSVKMKYLTDSFRLRSYKMFIKMDSVPSLRNGKNVNELIISQKQFDSIILKLTNIIKNKDFNEISNQNHIEFIRLLNTIDLHDINEKTFIKELIKLLDNSFYDWKLSCLFHWTYSPGVGYHYIELEAELFGKGRTRYKVID